MTTANGSSVSDRVKDLHDYIARGRIVEALREFYSEGVEMQDNSEEPTRGLDANIEREEAWLRSVGEWKGFELKAIAVEGNTSFAETTMDYVTKDGQEVHGEQVSRAIWRDGRIVSERFYHP